MSLPRVLVVDDDRHICFVVTQALETIAECDTAYDVDEATRALERTPYDLALVDVSLPGPSGMTLLDRLRRSWPGTAAVMLSGATDLSVAREALDRGALGYVVKPFRVRDLRIQVTAALASAHRSANAAHASTRGTIVAGLTGLVEGSDRVACFAIALEHVSLLVASYGVDAVDRLCERVEERLREFHPAVAVLGRLGPATFVGALVLPPGRSPSEAAQGLHRALSAPAVVDGRRIPIAARMGMAVASPGEGADAVLSLAESAAASARDYAQPYVVYDGDVRDTARVQQELLADVAAAIHGSRLHVAYQRQQDLTSGRSVGFEALARWHHPLHGEVPASLFVPLAERVDLIDELGAFVLRTACTDVARLRRVHDAAELHVSVNASAAELRDVEYPDRVARALAAADLPASALRLEITESVALDESDEVDGSLARLQGLGVALCIDDFGTGYSSFAILSRIPWAEIKLDRSLVAQCREKRGREMLRAIVTFGNALDVDVIAEGIETNAELEALRELGCRYGQGFLLGRPEPISAVLRRAGRAAA